MSAMTIINNKKTHIPYSENLRGNVTAHINVDIFSKDVSKQRCLVTEDASVIQLWMKNVHLNK